MQGNVSARDNRIVSYITATQQLQRGNFQINLPPPTPDDVGQLGSALDELARTLEKRYQKFRRLNQITTRINAGLLLEEVLEGVYRDFREVIPYNRIGFSLIDNQAQTERAVWTKSELPVIRLAAGFTAPLKGSSLQKIVETRQPRIINDLCRDLDANPDSEATQLMVLEGIRSSLTCPLVASGVPVGFMFFSSTQPNAYANVHVAIFLHIAELLAEHPSGLAESERLRILQGIQHETDAMLTLLNDLLDVAQIEAATFSLKPAPLPLAEFLAGVAEHHARLASAKGHRSSLIPWPAARRWPTHCGCGR